MSVMPVPRMATSVAAHADTPASAGRCSPTNAARSSPKCSTAGEPATITRMWRAPGVRVAAQGGGAGLGRARHQVALEGLGRQAVELREPLGAPDGRLVVVSDTGKDDDAGLHGLGISAGLGRLAPQGRQGGPVLVRGEEEGNPAVADGGGPPPGGGAGAPEPQRDRAATPAPARSRRRRRSGPAQARRSPATPSSMSWPRRW